MEVWRRRAEVEVVADVEASASKPHSKVSAAGRRLGMGHRLTASLGYSVLRLQVWCGGGGAGSGAAAADLGMEAVGPPPRRRSKAGRGWLDEMAAAPSTLSITSAVRMPRRVCVAASSARGGIAGVGLRGCNRGHRSGAWHARALLYLCQEPLGHFFLGTLCSLRLIAGVCARVRVRFSPSSRLSSGQHVFAS